MIYDTFLVVFNLKKHSRYKHSRYTTAGDAAIKMNHIYLDNFFLSKHILMLLMQDLVTQVSHTHN